MTMTDDILSDLRQGVPLKKVRQKFRSQSQLYEALRIYLPEASSKVEELQGISASLTSQKTTLEQQNSSLKNENEELVDTNDRLQQEDSNLTQKLEEKRGELESAEKQLSELKNSGVTKEILTRVQKMDSKGDLLEKVSTAAEYNKVKQELAGMTQKKTEVKEEIEGLSKKKKSIMKEVKSQENLLDEHKTKTATFRKAISVTASFFADGYNTKDLTRLKDGLKLLGIKAKPELSIDRLIRGLERIKTLSNLDASIRKNAKKLETLKADIVDAEAELKTHAETTQKILDDSKERALKQIEDTGRQSVSAIEELKANSEKSFSAISRTAGQKLEAVNQTIANVSTSVSAFIDEKGKTFNSHIENALSDFNRQVSDAMKLLRTEHERAQELTNRAAVQGELMKYAYCLLGILKIPDGIREVPLSLVAQLADRLNTYIEIRFAKDLTKPSKAVHEREPKIYEFFNFRLSALSLWLKEELEKRNLEETKTRSGV